MDINKVLMEYDNMYGVYSLDEIDEFLENKVEEALTEGDGSSALTLMNEMLGLCRDTGKKEKGLHYCELTKRMLDKLNLAGTTEYATALLNVASTQRAFGEYKASMLCYRETESIYRANLSDGDFAFSGLYNNWSLLYQEMGDLDSAVTLLKKALEVVDAFPDARIEQATTRTNLAMTLISICRREQEKKSDSAFDEGFSAEYYDTYDEALLVLDQALYRFEIDGGRDYHYGAALSTKGDAYMLAADFNLAIEFYERSLNEIEKHTGRNASYNAVLERLEAAKKKAGITDDYDDRQNGEPDRQNTNSAGQKRNAFAPVTINNTSLNAQANEEGKKSFRNNLERCRDFYENYGEPMIRELFPEYAGRIAAGMCGEGSDCFGFEDDISKDHDYCLGFCIWLTDADYSAIGRELQEEYGKLVKRHAEDYGDDGNALIIADERRGVTTVGRYYQRLLGITVNEHTDLDTFLTEERWLSMDEAALAAALNGAVFADGEGSFTRIRRRLKAYYPDRVWRLRLAQTLHDFSQTAQSNYARAMARGDDLTALIIKGKAAESALKLVYLINRSYAPYYKWLAKGAAKLLELNEVTVELDKMSLLSTQRDAWAGTEYIPTKLNTDDKAVVLFERVAKLILDGLKDKGLVSGSDTFLDTYVAQLAAAGADDTENTDTAAEKEPVNVRLDRKVDLRTDMKPEEVKEYSEKRQTPENEDISSMSHDALVDSIVLHEWKQFDKVKNEGGRADCQDNWNTFSIMRKSQYMTWEDELLRSFLYDLVTAEAEGRNLVTEKYGRMMESTAPEEYESFKDSLPEKTDEHRAIAGLIIKIQVEWMEEFAKKYPRMAGNARKIHTSEDTPFETSYETYLRGELMTYSDDTLYLYGRFVVGLKRLGMNLAYMIMDNTAKLYGYRDVKDAEEKLAD
ncbi:MAG: DUF4125 family protein [Lachnospiraceae bacterium]|nr:DUF4125 family protein [Lachnospiraceae bacterium]